MRIFPLIVFIFLASATNACIIKGPVRSLSLKQKRMYGPWTDKVLKRNTVASCECGKKYENSTFQWNLYIFVERTGNPVCTGTIITSNLVATSHECIIIPGSRPNVFELWNVSKTQPRSFTNTSDILVTASPNKTEGESFPVEEIIISANYLVDFSFGRFLYNDILLLKLKADFTLHSTLSPICIPEDSSDHNFIRQVGEYYGNDKLAETFSNDGRPLPYVHEGVILAKGMCDSEYLQSIQVNDATDNQGNPKVSSTDEDPAETLLLQWNDPMNIHPDVKGGPLIFRSAKNSTAFLAGIACEAHPRLETSGAGTGTHYAYFTNILVTIKYIEYHAHAHQSKWCKLGELKLMSEKAGPLPWEQEHIITNCLTDRTESLDCVCGIANTQFGGRISGGEEATPYEFGWMAVMRLYLSGRSERAFSCGGTIINDRMILTAAHCVVKEGTTYPGVKPEDIDLWIHSHLRVKDDKAIKKEVQTVLFHPNFAIARSRLYYDFDIALLILKDPIQFAPGTESGIRPICLPKIGEKISLIGQMATVAGWGLTDPTNMKSSASKLQKVELPILDLERCREVARATVTDRFICAGYLNKYKDAAGGDSGGPLKIKQGKQWTEVGVVSWGEEVNVEENKEKTAALYTDLTNKLIISFVDFYAKRSNAHWCKSTL